MKIIDLKAREVLDSRGYPTVEVDMFLENNLKFKSLVPSGASVGKRECLELRDNDVNRFLGKGVLKAVNNVNSIIRDNLIGKEVDDVDKILLSLDKSNNKSGLGVNSILPVSLCAFKYRLELSQKKYSKVPFIMCNILNGGLHSDNGLGIQEFMIIPKGKNIFESIRMAAEVFHNLKKILKEKGYIVSVGDEGGFSPNLNFIEEALDMIILAIKESNYVPGLDIFVGLDVAATHFFEDGFYHLDKKVYDSSEFVDKLIDLVEKYPIVSIEDPLEENDFLGFSKLTEKIGDRVMIVGDDLFTTNCKYLKKGIELGSCNAILIKPNQIGTIKEVSDVVRLAKKNNYKVIFSHRSGDTEDCSIADLAVYYEADYVKFGSMSRSERTSKYNQLIRIFEN